MVSKSTLHRASRAVVLNAVTNEGPDLAVIQANGKLHFHVTLGSEHARSHSIRNFQVIGGSMKIDFGFRGHYCFQGRGGDLGLERRFTKLTKERHATRYSVFVGSNFSRRPMFCRTG